MPNLLYRNREYDKNIRQILFRVGYTIQFNKESEFTDKSTLLLVLIRSSNHIIHKLSFKTLIFSSYFVEGKRYDRGVCIKENDFIKKEELVSKICHWKQIVNDYMIRIHQEKYIPFILCFTDTTKQIFIEYSDESLCELIEIMENDSIEGMMKLIDDNVIKFIQWRISKQLKKELGVEFAEMEEEMEQQIDEGEKEEKEKEGKNDDNNSILKRKYGDEEFSKSLITIDDVKNEEYYEILL